MSNKKEGSSGSFDKLNTDNNNNKKNLSKQNSEVENGLNKLENNKSNTEINLIKQISTEGESYEIEYSIDQIQNPIDKSSDLKQFNLERIRKLQTFDLEYKNKYYEDYFNSYSIDSYENQEISLIQFNQNTIIDFKNSENILERTKSSSGSGCGNQEIPTPINFSSTDGYGHANIERAFEILKGIDISSKDDLGGNLWGLDNIGAPEVWTSTGCFSGSTGKDVVVAVLDTGLDYSHSEFSGRIVDGYDFIDNDNIAQDVHGHGTHCSGTILGANDGVGITGVAYDAKIMPIKVLNDSGRGSIAGIVAGMRWAVDNGADVLNLSLGGGAPNSDYLDALKYAADNGVVVAMASGNSSSSAPLWPARYATDYGIAVGAVDINKNDAYFSNRAGNTTMDYVSAPGVNVYSSLPGGGYESWNGTSMAAPHVAGMAALLKSYDKTLTPLQIETLISASASNSDSNSSNNSNNYFESNSEFNMFYSKDFDDLFFESNELISGYEYSFDSNSSGSDYLDWALDLIGENNEKMYIAGTDGFYENQSKNKIEELNSFIDEINQGVEDKEEEIAYAGGTDGFYENQSKNKIEELNSFIDEINQGVEDKEEEIAYAGGTDGFYENQSKNKIEELNSFIDEINQGVEDKEEEIAYAGGTDGFYENQSKNKIEELNSFIDEINQGVEDKEEEIAYAGGTDGFYENQSKNKIEELNSFIDEINQGVEDKEEEIAYAGGTDGFYENQSKNKIEELNSFIDEINQGVEDKEEEIAYAGGTDGFYENQSKNKIEELNSFIDEINQGVEDKEEEIAYAGGTDGFYENQSKNKIEELNSFIDEINQGVEDKEEEIAYAGGTDGFYENQSKNGTILGFNSNLENENNLFEDNLILSNNGFQNYLENQNNNYSV